MSRINFFNCKVEWASTVSPLLVFCIFYIVVCALTPFTFSLDPSSSLLELFNQKFDAHSLIWSIPAWDVASNILLFIPFGLLFVSSPIVSRWNVTNRLLFTAVAAWLLSFTVEICQLFLPRAPSLVDTLTNTLGGFVGGLLGTYLAGDVNQWAHHLWLRIQRSRWLNWFLVVYVLILLAASGFPFPLSPNFSNWDPDYPLQLGNEATLDRPWLGKMFLVAVYDRALNPNEISTNFTAGASPKLGSGRVEKNLVALYDFRENSGLVVHDLSGFGKPLDLHISHPEKMKWLLPNGIEFLGNTSVNSEGFSKKFYASHIGSESQLTLEAWIASTDINQSGPARIISYSRNTTLRNFTLGQIGNNIIFRLRTPLSGLNGSHPHLKTRDNPLTTDLHHLVATFRDGWETLFIDAREREAVFLNKTIYPFQVLDELFGFKYKWVYWFLVISPLGFLSQIIFTKKWSDPRKVLFFSTLCGVGVLGVLEGLQVTTGQRVYDEFFIPIGTGIVFLSVLTSSIFSKSVKMG